MNLRAGPFTFSFPRPTLLMGVVNVTPDSFSDGGRFFDPAAAVAHARQLIEEGADIIDVGGESTRPGATPVSEAEELRRVLPVIEQLAPQRRVPISVDTVKPAVARAALAAGACIVNDVGANRADPEMWGLVAGAGAGYVAMHMQGTPATMQRNPRYQNVVREVGGFFAERLEHLYRCGVNTEQIILDPGLGFGKTAEHNLQLLGALRSFTKWNRPLLLGVSRKSFVGRVTGAAEADARLPGSLACACWAVAGGAALVRTHDVAETRQAVRMTEAILAHREEPCSSS
jgi:dihydropteroate synthase